MSNHNEILTNYMELIKTQEEMLGHFDKLFENQAENSRFQRKKTHKKYLKEIERQRQIGNKVFDKALIETLKNKGVNVKYSVTTEENKPGFFKRFLSLFKKQKTITQIEDAETKSLTNGDTVTDSEIIKDCNDEIENQTHIEDFVIETEDLEEL